MNLPAPQDTPPEGPVGFAIIPNWMVRDQSISWNAKAVYVVLASHADREGISWPSQKLIGAEAGMGATSVKAAIKELRNLRVLMVQVQKHAHGRRNIYHLAVSQSWNGGWVAQRPMGGSPSGQEEEPPQEEPSTSLTLGGGAQ